MPAKQSDTTHPNAAAFPPIGGPALRALDTAGIRSMAEVAKRSDEELLQLHGMGPKGVRLLREALATQLGGTALHADTTAYNAALTPENRAIGDQLAREIANALPEAENKIWHAHPVWFLNGNPIVGYSKLKDCMRLLFWSGQSFDEAALRREGTFKAAEARFTEASQINTKDLRRWLKKARDIQWDYKNLIKRKGQLERLK